jgi:hypothetical protein
MEDEGLMGAQSIAGGLIHWIALRAAEIAQGESHFAAQGIIGWHFAGQ